MKLTETQINILLYCIEEVDSSIGLKFTTNREFVDNLKEVRSLLYKERAEVENES